MIHSSSYRECIIYHRIIFANVVSHRHVFLQFTNKKWFNFTHSVFRIMLLFNNNFQLCNSYLRIIWQLNPFWWHLQFNYSVYFLRCESCNEIPKCSDPVNIACILFGLIVLSFSPGFVTNVAKEGEFSEFIFDMWSWNFFVTKLTWLCHNKKSYFCHAFL